MKISKILICLILTLCFSFTINAATAPIKNFDLRYYNPKEFGLKDLVFNVKLSNLKSLLNKQKNFGKIHDIYFKVYWTIKTNFHIEIFGMPKGFQVIRQQLKDMIKERLDYVIPQKLADKISNYTLTQKKDGKVVYYQGKDKTHKAPNSEIRLWFDGHKLKRYKTYGASGSIDAKFSMKIKSWSHNKFLVSNVKVTSYQGMQKIVTDNNFTYESISGFGLPKKIDIVMNQEVMSTNKIKENAENRKVNSYIEFNSYEINTGKAKKRLDKLSVGKQ